MSRSLKIVSRRQNPESGLSAELASRRVSAKTSSPSPGTWRVRQTHFNLNPPLLLSLTPGLRKKCRFDVNLVQKQARRPGKEERIALEAIDKLILTISHYLNTPLTVLLGKVELLSEATENGGMREGEIKNFAESCKREILKIESIMKAFQNLCEVRYKTYPPGIKMLDVEKEIEDRLKEIEAFDLDIIATQGR